MLRVLSIVGTMLVAGCPSTRPPVVAPKVSAETALRIRIAQAEVKRADGVADLLVLAADKDVHTRELALRGLGRSGDPKAYAALEQALGDPDQRIIAAAAAAIGVAASLDDKPIASAALVAVLPKVIDARTRAAVIEAIGRAGDESSQDVLLVQPDPESVAFAFARFARRKLKVHDLSREHLVLFTSQSDPKIRYAGTYALARDPDDPDNQDVIDALVRMIGDPYAETRAQAIVALVKRKHALEGWIRRKIEAALTDADWRVVVEAERALAGADGDDEGRASVAAILQPHLDHLASHVNQQRDDHIVVEAMRVFLEHPAAIQLQKLEGWGQCLQEATQPSVANARTAEAIASCTLPDHLKLPLLAELFDDKRSDATYRRAALRILLAHDDPRVRAAGIGALPKAWNDGDEHAQATIVGTVVSALAVKNPIVAGAAIEAAEALYDAMGAAHSLRATLDAALVQRATTESDVELAQSLYALIGKKKIASGADACRSGLDMPPAAAKAASECLTALGEPAAATPRVAPPPPVDVASVIGKRVVWHVKTTRGSIDIELHPDVAPWAVATIVSLSQRGFYDHKEFHRVVPDFVVQGGDPTESGWGGPGFMLPAEPASVLDGPGFVQGGVGMADAGRDSGGSQWFIMHSRAAHLDGRYTWVGSVIAGQNSADLLQIGDRVESATVELRPLSR